jgi:hypothetical protein
MLTAAEDKLLPLETALTVATFTDVATARTSAAVTTALLLLPAQADVDALARSKYQK